MTMVVVSKYVHHGREVSVIEHMKGRHRISCLCFIGCKHFKPNDENNCRIAKAVFHNCVEFGLVTPVVECPEYEA